MKTLTITITLATAMLLSAPAIADWTIPVPVESGINTEFDEWMPYLSYDGLSLYFTRFNTDQFYRARIFEARRNTPSGPFTEVREVLRSSDDLVCPWVSPDNLRMYYHQEGPTWYVKVSQRASVNDPWVQGTVVPGLPSRICLPALSADELTIVFTDPHVGGWDTCMATRPDINSPFGNVRNLAEINTTE